MLRKVGFTAAMIAFLTLPAASHAQTTNGLVTGQITDSTNAVVVGAQVTITNQSTAEVRSAVSGSDGTYIVPQLPPGIYSLTVTKQGFAAIKRQDVQLQVNQSITLNFQLGISSSTQTVEVTGAPPALNTTSATVGEVIGEQATVDLPLNGREFTELTLLTPGVAPVTTSQQSSFTVPLGAGGISPSVNGQRGEQNNFTMDGTLNNSIFINSWAISPPPDAIQEFNVQSHMTDAQFAISSGANINLVTRSGTNAFHGSVWEFLRNDALDAQGYPETARLPYRQNQYGLFLGGPVLLPHFHGRDNTWFAGYWEGFRSSQSLSYFGGTLTAAERTGDFSAILGPPVGTDDLGRTEYQNEIYNPATSRPDPVNPGVVLRDPYPGNIIPGSLINPAIPIILNKYYPLPNLNVAPGVLPNIEFVGTTAIASDQAGIRIDHRFRNNDVLFGRYNRSNITNTTPEQLPGFDHYITNYGQEVAAGYTHLFGSSTVLNLRYGWTVANDGYYDGAAGLAFEQSIGFADAAPPQGGTALGPEISISNGFSGVNQFAIPLGPQYASDIHADLSKVKGNHTLGVGGMFYHIYSFDGGFGYNVNFTQNTTSQGALAAQTGNGAASFMLGLPDNTSGWVGDSNAIETMDWYAGYLQDQWKATPKVTVSAGLRYDFITPANYYKVLSGLDVLTGLFVVTQPVPPLFPKATGPSGYFQYNFIGFQPRFGVVFQAAPRTVARVGFAMFDDHNNTLVQENQGIRVCWPTSDIPTVTLLNRGQPTTYINNLPPASTYLNPLVPYASALDANPHNLIPYVMEFNAGVQQQLSNSLVLDLDYMGSLGRRQYINPTANTAVNPGPGSLVSRGQPYPQYGGGPVSFEWNDGPSSYNALQAKLRKSVSNGLMFLASYTWSKSMDVQSDPYGSGVQDFYDMHPDWGPSNYDIRHMFTLSGVYTLPVGRGKALLSNTHGLVQGVVGNWNVGSIITLRSGLEFNCSVGDVANVGGGSQRCDETGNPYAGPAFQETKTQRLNPASFTSIPYTFGTEKRDDLVGPRYSDVDFNIFKNIDLFRESKLQIRGEFFNLFNHTNFGNPNSGIPSPSFGLVTTSYFPREIQLAAKIIF